MDRFMWCVCPICEGLMITGKDGLPRCDRCHQRLILPVTPIAQETTTSH